MIEGQYLSERAMFEEWSWSEFFGVIAKCQCRANHGFKHGAHFSSIVLGRELLRSRRRPMKTPKGS